MELYYHISYMNKRKGCRFHFTLIKKNGFDSVKFPGSAFIDFRKAEFRPSFDPESEQKLNDADKMYVVSYVLKYISTSVNIA